MKLKAATFVASKGIILISNFLKVCQLVKNLQTDMQTTWSSHTSTFFPYETELGLKLTKIKAECVSKDSQLHRFSDSLLLL
jgi:hypothetical protein